MASAAPQQDTGDKDKNFIRFPPFPTAPEGVTIIPFKDWKESGIQLFSTRSVKKSGGNEGESQEFDDDIEVDGLGIPTVELSKKHDTDSGKSDARKRRKARSTQKATLVKGAPSVPHQQKPWWQIWEEVEENRLVGPYEPGMTSIDRIYQAAHDFKVSRPWPPGTTGADYLWDQWRLYAGLRAITPIWRRTDKIAKELAEDDAVLDDIGSDDGELEDEPAAEVVMGPQPSRPHKRPRPRPPYYNYGTDPVEADSDEAVRDLLEEEQYRKDERLVDFVNNMEKNTAIFLSSYVRKQGLIWSDRYLDAIPRILHFFLRFIKRNKLLPDPQNQKSIATTMPLVELALLELPLTSKIAKLYPDNFGQGAKECWGQKAEGYNLLFPEAPSPAHSVDVEEVRTPAAEADSSPQVVEPQPEGSGEGWDIGSENNAAWEALDQDQVVNNSNWESTQAWGEPLNTSGHASVPAEPDPPPTFDFVDEEMGTTQKNPWVPDHDWTPPKPHSLSDILGPTALPITHTTGVVEASLRKLKSVTMPVMINLKKASLSGTTGPSAAAVEEVLETTFARVVFGPWLGWDHHEGNNLSEPKILDTSRGPAILPPEQNDVPTPPAEGVHSMYQDDITCLVEPKVAEVMAQCIGMGYGGTWVQIVRREEVEEESQDLQSKVKKGKDPKAMKYWYNEELMLIIPSFYQ